MDNNFNETDEAVKDYYFDNTEPEAEETDENISSDAETGNENDEANYEADYQTDYESSYDSNINSDPNKMRPRFTRIWAFCFWPGFFVAKYQGNHDDVDTKFCMNEGLGLTIVGTVCSLYWIVSIFFGILSVIPYIGWLFAILNSCILYLVITPVTIFTVVCNIVGLVGACRGYVVTLPIFSKFNIIK